MIGLFYVCYYMIISILLGRGEAPPLNAKASRLASRKKGPVLLLFPGCSVGVLWGAVWDVGRAFFFFQFEQSGLTEIGRFELTEKKSPG